MRTITIMVGVVLAAAALAFAGLGARAASGAAEDSCVFVARPDGTGLRFLSRGTGSAWSPDSATLAVRAGGVRLVRRNGSLVRDLAASSTAIWIDAGRLLVDIGSSYGIARRDGGATRTLRTPQLEFATSASVASAARLVVVAGVQKGDEYGTHTLVFFDANGRLVATSRGYYSKLSVVSPDGRRIAVTSDYNVAGRSTGVRVRNGSGGTGLVGIAASAFAWSRDSKRLAVSLVDTGSDMNATAATAGLYLHDVARKGSFRRLARHRSTAEAMWSPSGARLSFVAGGTLFTVPTAGGGLPVRIAPNVMGTAWSPDGNRLAYASGGAVFVVKAAGGAARRLTPPGGYVNPTWSPDGSLIAFTRVRDGDLSAPPCPAA